MPDSPNVPSRDAALDATRTVAIWLMVACHAARLIPRSTRPDWLVNAMLIEPLCQALFMAMVGTSMVYSMRIAHRHGQTGWTQRLIRRAAELFAIGVAIFFVQRGWQWPWTLTGHGILLAISIAMIASLPVVLLGRHRPSRGLMAALVTTVVLGAAASWMDHIDLRIPVLNAGNGALLPFTVLTGFGIIAAHILLDHRRKAQLGLLAILAAGAALTLHQHGFTAAFSKPLGRHSFPMDFWIANDGFSQIYKILTGQRLEAYEARYYTFRPVLIPILMAMIAGIYTLARLLGPVTHRLNPLWLVGRHSLSVYVLHLILLAVPVIVIGKNKPWSEPWQANLTFGVVLALCYAYAALKTNRRRRKINRNVHS